MKTMFFGIYSLPLRESCTLTLPSGIREAAGSVAYLTQGFDRNLMLLPQPAFDALTKAMGGISISDPLGRLLNRMLLGSATEVEIDQAGQVTLPQGLCEYARLGEEAVLVGQGDHAEIWSKAEWQKQLDSMNDPDLNSHRFENFHVSLKDPTAGGTTRNSQQGELP